MKILFTGGGTGGHFYPIIAVAEAVNEISRKQKLLDPQLYYAAPDPYDRQMLLAQNITFVQSNAGKMRRYFSLLNFFDWIKTGFGVLGAIMSTFSLYPDVVFGKGGYTTFPTLVAARLFNIPVVIHESDSVPGIVNRWAGKFARKIAVSYPEAAEFFPKDKVAYTGNPIRKAVALPISDGAYEFLKLDRALPILLVLGGSQGAQAINEAILEALPALVEHYQVVHQTGAANIVEVEGRAKVILGDSPLAGHYKPFAYLNDLAMRMSAGVASLVISRAGSTIFEIAAWGLPAIVVPIPETISHDQTKNAFAYARSGAAVVIEQNNLTPSLLASEIQRILQSKDIIDAMKRAAKKFAHADAAETIASALIDIGLTHES